MASLASGLRSPRRSNRCLRSPHLDQRPGPDEGFWGTFLSLNGLTLVNRLRMLSPAKAVAVVDAVERAWTSPEYRIKDMGERIYLADLPQKVAEQK
jgi:hypothetical protein